MYNDPQGKSFRDLKYLQQREIGRQGDRNPKMGIGTKRDPRSLWIKMDQTGGWGGGGMFQRKGEGVRLRKWMGRGMVGRTDTCHVPESLMAPAHPYPTMFCLKPLF